MPHLPHFFSGDVVTVTSRPYITGPITDILPNNGGVYRVTYRDDRGDWRRYWASRDDLTLVHVGHLLDGPADDDIGASVSRAIAQGRVKRRSDG